jgi:flagellar assembly factor FliW
MFPTTLLNETETDAVELHFAAGLPGFPELHRFALTSWGRPRPDSPFMLMNSLDDPDVGFVVISPYVFYPDYTFDLDDTTVARLALTEPQDALVVCIVTLGDRPEDATVNLLGPIVINRRNLEACQTVLPHTAYEVRAPLAA